MRLLCLSLILCAIGANAQYRRRTTPNSPGDLTGGAYNQPSATMHGTLKKITSKDIVILVEGDQSVDIDRTHKTKFLKDGKEIKPADIAAGSVVTVDVNHDPQLHPLAITLTVDSGPTDLETPPATTGAVPASTSSAPAPAKPAESTSQ
jgi:hypothetical protein